jgi:Mn-dependent DtxR family transcriptional regulator
MANIFFRVSKSSKIIRLCEKPIRFTALKKEARISDAGLTKILTALRRRGWIRKRDDKMYQLTAAGRTILPQVQLAEILLLNFNHLISTTPKLLENVTISHLGLKGEDGESLLREIAQAMKRHLALPSNERIVLIVQYTPPEFPVPLSRREAKQFLATEPAEEDD